jgi:hypothetical protein
MIAKIWQSALLALLLPVAATAQCSGSGLTPECCAQAEQDLTLQYEWYLWSTIFETGGELEMLEKHRSALTA